MVFFTVSYIPLLSPNAARHFLYHAEEMYKSIHHFLQSVISLAFFECWTRKLKDLKLVLLCCISRHRTQRVFKRIHRVKANICFQCCRCVLMNNPDFHFPFVPNAIPERSQRIWKKQRPPRGVA